MIWKEKIDFMYHGFDIAKSDFHRLDDLAQGGIITDIEIKDIKQLVEILKNRDYKIKQGRG